MTLGELLGSARRNLRVQRLRSILSMLGMVFGVAAVIAMLAIGAGAERQAMEMIERLGVRNLIVRGRDLKPDEVAEVRKRSPGLAPRDGEAILQGVDGVEEVVAQALVQPARVRAENGPSKAVVRGVSHRHAALFGLAVADGRFLDALDERSHAQVCVLGDQVRRELFGHEAAVGRLVKLNDLWLEVVGVLAPGGGATSFQGVQIGGTSNELLLPVTTVLRKLDRDPTLAPLDEIVVRLAPQVSPRAAGAMAGALMERLHAGADDYELVVPEALLESSRRTQRMFAIVMGCIAGISLLVGGIGIMNIMLASVLERTREIGVRRAVGATRRDVRDQFVIEAMAISLAGGLAGIGLGVAIAGAVAASAGWPTVVTAVSVLVSFGVSVAVGLASGIYPALRAADLDPIEALRYE